MSGFCAVQRLELPFASSKPLCYLYLELAVSEESFLSVISVSRGKEGEERKPEEKWAARKNNMGENGREVKQRETKREEKRRKKGGSWG